MEIGSLISLIDWEWINHLTNAHITELHHKSPMDWSTEVDVAIEKHLLKAIEAFDPFSNVLSEEAFEAEVSPIEQVDSPYQWFVDPLDGTFNFTLGLPYYGIQLACWHKVEERPILGLIYIPALKELVLWDTTMEKGILQIWNSETACFRQQEILPWAKELNLASSLLCFGDFSSSNKASRPFQGQLTAYLGAEVGKIRMHGTSSLDFHLLCTERTHGYLIFTKRPWEIYPGLAMAQAFGLPYECLEINSTLYKGTMWLIARSEIFDELKGKILSM